jgi:hypothetical protein
MSNSPLKKFEVAVFYILSGLIVVYMAVEIIELFYQVGLALLTPDEESDRLLFTIAQTARSEYW